MNHNEFFSSLKSGQLHPCYLFEGEEEFTKASALKAIREHVASGDFAAMNDTRLVDPAPDALIAAAETLPFLSDRRFIEVRDSAMLLSGKAKEYDEDIAVRRLDEYLDHLPDTSVIVFYVRGKADARKKLYQCLKKKAQLVSFQPLADQELTRWIAATLKKQGKKISASACQQLWFTVGKDMTLLYQEIGKLTAYAGDADTVTERDIAAICVQSTEYKVFDMLDILLSGQGGKAMRMQEALLRDGEERLMILSLLGRQCRQMCYAKALAADGAQPYEIANKTGAPSFAVQKLLNAARAYSLSQLKQIAQLCLDTEYLVKSGQLNEAGSLEAVTLQILSMREANRYG
ncbi:MAG: DNA polymerase III subunit delta [Clostridia bacterium]|nr:DNA polymerase III subunit delta [Clostridia bacterium]